MDDRPTFPATINDRYALEGRLGAGSLGVVFRARHLVLDEPLAVKLLHPELAKDSIATERFLDEARVGSAVPHPNAVRIRDVGSTGDQPYLAMGFVSGLTLAELLRHDGPLALQRVGHIGVEICDVLGSAHDKGLTHGGLTLSKVIVSDDSAAQLTVLGFRVQGGDTHRDQRALGAVLYELAAGRRPIHSKRPALPASVTAPFAEVIHRMLEDDPTAQYGTVRDAAKALQSAAAG